MDKDLAVVIEDQHHYVSRMADAHHKAVLPVAFTMIYAQLVAVARECGYALALHGSMGRDLDLIAIPWVEDALSAEELVARIMACSAAFRESRWPINDKPHGRRSWVMHLGGGPYIDLSIMPRARKEEIPNEAD